MGPLWGRVGPWAGCPSLMRQLQSLHKAAPNPRGADVVLPQSLFQTDDSLVLGESQIRRKVCPGESPF